MPALLHRRDISLDEPITKSSSLIHVTAAIFLILINATSLHAQSGEDIGTLPALMTESEAAYKGFDCPTAAEKLARALAIADGVEHKRPLRPEEDNAVIRAHEILASCDFESGKADDTKGEFTAILTRRPDYQVPAGSSAKIKKLLEDLRAKLLGTVSVATTPPGAEIFYNGRSLGKTPADVKLMAGPIKFELKAPGFAPVPQELTLGPGAKNEPVSVKLTPTGRQVIGFTRPDGVELLVDGRVVGASAPNNELTNEAIAILAAASFPPDGAGAADLGFLTPGEHQITFRKPCFKPESFSVKVELDIEKLSRMILQPVTLKPVKGNLRLDSRPTGATLSIDGKAEGTTPFERADFCGGEHAVKVEMTGRGRWSGRIEIADGETVALTLPIRANLLYLGVFTGGEEPSGDAAVTDGRLRQKLAALKRYNAVLPAADDLLVKAPDALGALARAVPGAPAGDGPLAAAAAAYDAQLVAALLPPGSAAPGLKLFAARSKAVDLITDEGGITALVARLDDDALVPGLWLGAGLAEAQGFEGLAVGSTAGLDPALLAPGDRLVKLDGKRINTLKELNAAIAGHQAGDTLDAARLRGGAETPVKLKLMPIYRHLPTAGPPGPAGKLEVDAAMLALDPDPLAEPVAQLNLALIAMRAGRNSEALDLLVAVKLPVRRGLSVGTVEYLKAQIYLTRGEREAARASLAAAAADPGATFLGDDGPAIGPLAKAQLASISPPPPPAPPPVKR
jgi:hypothetical protein